MDAGLFTVRIAPEAREDLQRLTQFLIDRITEGGGDDFSPIDRLLDAMDSGWDLLSRTPHTCRRCAADPRLRELVIGFGHTGLVALFSIGDGAVDVLAVRHQREADYR
jgi:plasmid stabilization system protein ParE